MVKYRPKTPAANAADKLLRALLAATLGVSWFTFLWGLSLPALAAGLSLGALFWLCARLFGKKRVMRREAQLRRMLGGELALERLLMLAPRRAAFQAAIWLTPKHPLELQRTVDRGVTGTLEGKSTYLRLIAQHESLPITAQQLVEAARECRELKAQLCLLCVTAPLSREASAYLLDSPVPMELVKREELIALAGLCSPATDADLARLSKRSRKRLKLADWARLALSPDRARRYLWYGAGMAALAFITGQWVYPLPAALCLALFAGCKLRTLRTERR